MANSYYENTRSLTTGTTASGASIDDDLDAIEAAFEQMEADISGAIRMTNGDAGSMEIADDATARASRVVGFDESGAVELQPGPGSYKGNHAGATNYYVRDIVKDAAGDVGLNNVYICNTNHLSTDLASDISNWSLLIDVAAVEAAKVAAALSESNAGDSETAAASSAGSASTSASSANTYMLKAADWAAEVEDVEVETGKYSAFHWAQKAAASAASISVTFEALDAAGDVGTGAAQLAAGNHSHSGTYEPADSTILKSAHIGSSVQGYSASTATVAASQAEMEAGVVTALRSMTPQRVKQAIDALASSGSEVAVLSGTISHGGTIPLPSGYTSGQCKWMVSYSSGIDHDITCSASGTRTVTCSGKNQYGDPVNGTANYIIIGVK